MMNLKYYLLNLDCLKKGQLRCFLTLKIEIIGNIY